MEPASEDPLLLTAPSLSDWEVRPSPPDPSDALNLMMYLMRVCVVEQEKAAAERPEVWGGVQTHLFTPIEEISVFDPDLNPSGRILFPKILPTHAARFSVWAAEHLPVREDSQV